MVGKATTRQKGPLGPPIGFEDQLVRRCWNENMSQRGWAPRPPVEQPGERERHTVMFGGAGEVNMLQSLFGLQLPLARTNLSNKVSGIYLFKEVFARLYYCANMYSAGVCV